MSDGAGEGNKIDLTRSKIGEWYWCERQADACDRN